MTLSMTGYATQSGAAHGYSWVWELRAVNGKGLDLRLRLPDWIEGLEAALRPMLTKSIGRGNVSLSLRISRDEKDSGQRLNTAQADAIIAAIHEIETRAMHARVSLAPSTAADIASIRGVLELGSDEDDTGPLKQALVQQLGDLIAAFNDMRAKEGAHLNSILSGQLKQVAELTEAASGLLSIRQADMEGTLRRNLAKVMDGVAEIDEARVAQELALITVKADVTEELDRLRAHVIAAEGLLEVSEPVGRKLDFLMHEFNREANTLCSKAQMKELTETGLALKVVIDQMREQVQNVE